MDFTGCRSPCRAADWANRPDSRSRRIVDLVTRAICLALALSSCAPAFTLAAHSPPPLALYVADILAFSAGCIVGINEFNAHPEQRNSPLMWSAFAVALLAWGPYWVVTVQ